jgi:hypothetical protein
MTSGVAEHIGPDENDIGNRRRFEFHVYQPRDTASR